MMVLAMMSCGRHVPADRLKTRGGVFALRFRRHRVKRDVIRVVDQNEIVESLVAGELDGFHPHAFLHTPVAGEADDMVVENRVFGGVEAGGGHLPGHRHSDGIANTLAQRTGRAFHTGGRAKLRMARSFAVKLAEILQLL
jgi:hypothetical protein